MAVDRDAACGDAQTKVLVVDDDPHTRTALRMLLSTAGYQPTAVATGREALVVARDLRPDIVLLDVVLPDITGRDVCREMRDWYDAPILMLSGLTGHTMIADALDVGADDYVTKPFSSLELLARMRALLRRTPPYAPGATVAVGDLVLDGASRSASVADRALDLTPTEFDIACTLARHQGFVVSAQTLAAGIWGDDDVAAPETLRVHISGLRRKLRQLSSTVRIANVYGAGYRMDTDAQGLPNLRGCAQGDRQRQCPESA